MMKRSSPVSTFFLLLLPVLLLAVYSFFQTRRQLVNQVYEERRSLAAVSAKMLHEKLDRLYEIGSSFANWPTFRQCFNEPKWEHVTELMQTITRDFPYVTNVFITDTAGVFKAGSTPGDTGENEKLNFSKWYDGVSQRRQPYLSEVYYHAHNKKQITSAFAVPVRNMQGKHAGILVLEVGINQLLEWSTDINVGKEGFVYIVDQKGHIAINPSYKIADTIIDYSSVPAVQKALQGKKDAEVLYNPVTKERRLSAYEQVPGYGWAVIVQEEAGTALSVNNSIRTVLFFYTFFVLLAIGFIWIILRALNSQRQTAIELKKSDDSIHLLVDNVKDYAIFMLDARGNIVNWNDGAAYIKGYTEADIRGKSFEIFYTDEEIKKGEPALNLLQAKQLGHVEKEGWRKKKDGSLFWANVVITAMKDENDQLYGYSKITRDITERKQTQEQLELLYRQVNQSNEAIYTVDAKRRVLSWNHGAEELYGYTREEALGKEVMQLLQTNVTKEELDGIMQAVGEKNFLRKELHRKTKGGQDVFVHTSSSAIRNEAGEITGYMIVNVDVTERKKLMETVNHLASMVEQSSEAIISRGMDKTLISWNRGAELLLGYTREEVIGRSAVDVGFVKHTPEERADIEKALEEHGSWTAEKQFYHKNGSSFWGSVTASVVKNEYGIINSVVFIIKDISLRRQLEEQLKTANEVLEKKVKERTVQIYKSELRYRSLIENSVEGISLMSENGDVLYRSPSGKKMLGNTRRHGLIELAHPENLDMFRAKFAEALQHPGKPVNYRVKYRHEDGHYFLADGTFTNMLHVDGVNAVVDNYHDVTEKVQAEEKLLYNERRFRALIEKNYDVIILFDRSFKIIYRSPSATHITGRNDAETMGNPATNNIHPDDLPAIGEKLSVLMQRNGNSAESLFRYQHKDGHYIWLEGTATNLLEDESVQAIIFNCRDVSKRKEAEEKLVASEERFRTLIENSTDVINLVDESLNVIYRSPSAGRITGLTDEDILNKSISSSIHPDEKELAAALIQQTLANPGVPIFCRLRSRHKLGHYVWLEGVVTNLLHNKYVNAVLLNLRDISERVKAEEKLLASENRFRALVEKNQDVIMLLDESFNVIYRSPSATTVNGWTDEEVKTMSAVQNIHPGDLPYVQKLIATVRANPGKSFDAMFRNKTKAGNYIWLEGVATNLLNDSNVKAIVFNFRDVTQRVEADEKLKEQKAQLKTLGDNLSGVMIYQLISSPDGTRKFTYISKGVTNLTGKTPEEVMADPSILYNNILEEDKPAFIAAEEKSTREFRVFNHELRFVSFKNEVRWLKIVSTPRIQQNGTAVWDGFQVDITEQKEALKKLEDSEARFRSLTENNTDAIVLNDANSKILYQSPSVERILGYSLAERINKRSLDFIHPDSREAFIELFERLKVTPGQPLPFQFLFLHKSGRNVWLEGVVTNLLNDPGVNAYVANYRDVTERREAEEKIRQLNESLEIKIEQRTRQLKKSNEELEAFSYSISHDLRAPLRGIMGFTSILEEEYSSKLDDEAKRLTNVIKANSLKMGNLIDDLLTFSRTGRMDIEKILINNNSMVQDIIAGIEQKDSGNAIEWVVPDLLKSHADPTTIRQVWINLISNAVKYTSKQTLRRVEIGSYSAGNERVFFVKDNGVGFDNKYSNKLFKVFQRLHTSAEFEGTGVGLAIVEKIIVKHGGRVWADAVKGEGATFYFTLPDEQTTPE